MQDQIVERRSEPRLDLDIPIGYRINGMTEFEDAVLVNMSKNGLLMFTMEPMMIGTQVDVFVEAEDERDEALMMHVEILRVDLGHTAGFSYACRVYRHESISN